MHTKIRPLDFSRFKQHFQHTIGFFENTIITDRPKSHNSLDLKSVQVRPKNSNIEG